MDKENLSAFTATKKCIEFNGGYAFAVYPAKAPLDAIKAAIVEEGYEVK